MRCYDTIMWKYRRMKEYLQGCIFMFIYLIVASSILNDTKRHNQGLVYEQ